MRDVLRSQPWDFDVASIAGPVHAFHGDRDSLERIENIQRILARIDDATLTVLAGGDHLAPLLDPDAILAATG